MAKNLELAKHFEPFIVIPLSTTVAEAQHMLNADPRNFGVLGDIQRPQTLVQASHLAQLANDQQQSLESILAQLPPLIMLGGDRVELGGDELEQFSLLLEQTKAPGLVFYKNKQVCGVISWETIADALPLSSIPSVVEKGAYEGLAGNPITPPRVYVCLKCAASDPPPPFSIPREDDKAPICPRHWIHGPMQRKDA